MNTTIRLTCSAIIALSLIGCQRGNTERLIKVYSNRHKVDSNLITALITVESNFDPKAKSSANCRGLTQLEPRTAKWICGIKDVKKLYKPNINIACGIKVYKYYLKRAKGDVYKALRYYNAGERGANKYNIGHKYATKVLTVKQNLESQ